MSRCPKCNAELPATADPGPPDANNRLAPVPFRGLLIGAAIGVTAAVAAPFALGCIGFTAAGVAVGSIAASIQGAATVAGSAFAVAQSVAAVGGLSAAAGAGVTLVGAAAGGLTEALTKAPQRPNFCSCCGRELNHDV